MASGPRCPACSASHHPFLRSTDDSNPVTIARTVRRGSGRTNRRSTGLMTSSNSVVQAGRFRLLAAAVTARSSGLDTSPEGSCGGRFYVTPTPRHCSSVDLGWSQDPQSAAAVLEVAQHCCATRAMAASACSTPAATIAASCVVRDVVGGPQRQEPTEYPPPSDERAPAVLRRGPGRGEAEPGDRPVPGDGPVGWAQIARPGLA